MWFPGIARRVALRARAVALLVLTLAATAIAQNEANQADIKLQKDIYTVQGVKLAPLFIHDAKVQKEVDALLDEEAQLAEIEATLAADLSRLEDLVAADREMEETTWKAYAQYYNGLAGSGAARDLLKQLVAAPGMVSLHLACTDIGRKIDQLALKRHVLEEGYFASLGGVDPDAKPGAAASPAAGGGASSGGAQGPTGNDGAAAAGPDASEGKKPDDTKVFFGLDDGVQGKIVVHLRERVTTVQRLRRNAIENLLLANRWARESSFPSAVLERTTDWLTSDTGAIRDLEQKVKAKKSESEELQLYRSHKEQMARKLDERAQWLDQGVGPFRMVDGKRVDLETFKKLDAETRKQMAERGRTRAKKLRAEAAALKVRADALDKEVGELEDKIKQAKLGYQVEADKKDATGATPAAGAAAASKANEGGKDKKLGDDTASGGLVKLAGSVLDPRFAELVVRRRIYMRASREANHLFDLAKKFADLRRVQYESTRKESVALGFDPPSPAKLRKAYIDKGLAILAETELQKEDGFLGQLDYFQSMIDRYNKFGETAVEGDEFTTQATKHAVDSLQLAMGFASGLASGFIDQVKDTVNRGGIAHWKTSLDSAHESLLKERDERDKMTEFLRQALDLEGGALLAHFDLRPDPEPEKYSPRLSAPLQNARPVQLIKEDKDLYLKLDGGLRRIASSENIALQERLVTEYMIAYEKGCYTLRELWRLNATMKGLDAKKETFDSKLLFQPVTLSVRALRAAYSSMFGKLELERYMERRQAELDLMQAPFKSLKECGFDLREFLTKHGPEEASPRAHFRLYLSHPEYRRFWHTAARERYLDRKREVMKGGKDGEAWQVKADRAVRTGVLSDVSPKESLLAAAHWEDAQDKMQLYDYTGALQDLMAANKLDSRVVSWEDYRSLQNQMAWWSARGDVGQLALQLGDQFVWQCVTGGFSKAMSNYFDDLLGILPARRPAPPATWGDWLTAKATDFGNMLWGQVNPVAPFINVQTLMDDGLIVALGEQLWKTGSSLAQDQLRDEVLIKRWEMDPTVADKVAGLLWGLVDDGVKRYGKHYISKTAAYKQWSLQQSVEKLQRLEKRLKTPPTDIVKVLRDPEQAWFWQRWLARRRAMAIIQVMELRSQIEGLQDDLAFAEASKHVEKLGRRKPPRRGDESDKEYEERVRKEEEEAKRGTYGSVQDRKAAYAKRLKDLKYAWVKEALGTEELTPDLIEMVYRVSDFDPAKAQKFLDDEDANEDELWRQAEKAGQFLSMLGPRITTFFAMLDPENGQWPGDPAKREQFVKIVDAARRTMHLQSLNHMSRMLKDDDLRYLYETADAYFKAREEDHPGVNAGLPSPSKAIDPKRLKALLDEILFITSTGSAGHIGRQRGEGEYKEAESDLDYTIVLRTRVKPEERIALEFLLQSSFNSVSGGLNPRVFDIAYMVDEWPRWSGDAIELRGPSEIADLVEGADPETLQKYARELDQALVTQAGDFPHGERYQTSDRRRSLMYLTGLGDDVMLPEPGQKGLRFARRKKATLAGNPAALGKLPKEVQDFVTNKHARVDEWMAVGIIIDDMGFLGKKLRDLTAELHNPGATSRLLDQHVKEFDKRAIRIMKGFLTTTKTGREELNKLPKDLLEGATPNHGTLCDIMLRVIDSGEANFLGPDLQQVKKVVEGWKKVKMYGHHGAADNLVRNRRPGAVADGPGSPAYRRALADAMTESIDAMEAMAKQGMMRGSQKLKGLFDARTVARDDLKTVGQVKRLRKDMGRNPTEVQRRDMDNLLRKLGLPPGSENGQQFDRTEEKVQLRNEVYEKATQQRLRAVAFWQKHIGAHHSDREREKDLKEFVHSVFRAAGAEPNEYGETCEWMRQVRESGTTVPPARRENPAGGANPAGRDPQSRVPRHLWHAEPLRLAA